MYHKDQCQWPGCGRDCKSPASWRHHMIEDHRLNERSTAQVKKKFMYALGTARASWHYHMTVEHGQTSIKNIFWQEVDLSLSSNKCLKIGGINIISIKARVQMQIIAQLETQLRKEKDVLAAMMRHLHPDNAGTHGNNLGNQYDGGNPSPPPSAKRLKSEQSPDIRMSVPELFKSNSPYTNPLTHLMNLNPTAPSLSPLAALSSTTLPPTPTSIRSSLSEKSPYRYRVTKYTWTCASGTL